MFKKLLDDYEKAENERDTIINETREVIKLSKKIISSVHNEDLNSAEEFSKKIEQKISPIKKKRYINVSNASTAIQEYIEAILFLHYVKTGKIRSYTTFNCHPEDYLAGLCDFVGELQRRSVIRASKNDTEEIKKNYQTVNKLYDKLLDFSFRGELRKKFDSIKYIMMKMENLLLELKLK